MVASPDYTKFKLVPDAIGDVLLLNNLETNLEQYINWAFMQMGNWWDVDYTPGGGSNTSFPKTADPARCRLVDDPSYTSGQVWEAFRMQWVWEQGVDYVSPVDAATYNPNTVTVYVDGVLESSSNYVVNYRLGRIIFNTAKATTVEVRAEYAFRWVHTYTMDKAKWFREIQTHSFDGDNSDFLQQDSAGGGWSINGQHRVQLPAVVVEAVPRGTSEGYELGNGSLKISQDVMFHIVAEDSYMRNNLVDTFRFQKDKTIWLFDTDAIIAADVWPLDSNGDIANSNVYPDLVAEGGYRYKKCWFENCVLSEVQAIHPNLYEGTVTATLEIVYGNV